MHSVIHRHAQGSENPPLPNTHVPGWGQTRWHSAFCFSSCYKHMSCQQSMQYQFSHVSVFLLVILLVKMAPERCAEVLPSIPNCKEAVMCLMEKVRVRCTLFRHHLRCCWCLPPRNNGSGFAKSVLREHNHQEWELTVWNINCNWKIK